MPWFLKCVGVVEHVERRNYDKSGRNPRYNLHLHVRTQTVEASLQDASLPEVLVFTARKNEFGIRPPGEGDLVRVEGEASGRTASYISMKEVEVLKRAPRKGSSTPFPKKPLA